MPKTISMFGKLTNEGFYSGAPSGKEFKPAKKPLEVRKPIDVDATQKVAFDPDTTQKINNPNVTKEVPAFKAAGPKLTMKDLEPPKEPNAKLLMTKGPEAVMKANSLPQPKKIAPSAKIEPTPVSKPDMPEPKSPLTDLPKETLAGSPNFGGHRGFKPAFANRTPEAEPMHKQAPPSLANQNVRSRKRIGEGFFNRKPTTPIQRTSPSSVDSNDIDTPALWRRQDALSKSQRMPIVKTDASKVQEPVPSPAPAVVPKPPVPETPKAAEPAAPGPGSAPIANGPAPTFTSPADVKAGNTELKTAPRRPRSTGGGASSKKPVEGEPAEPAVAKPDVAAAKAEKAAEKEARAAANVATQKSKEIAAKVDNVHKGVMIAGHYAHKGAKQIFNTLNTWTKIKR